MREPLSPWAFLLLLSLTVGGGFACPSSCTCAINGVVRCEDAARRLLSVPIGLPSNTTVLHLKGNTIGTLANLPFLPNLHTLMLAQNKIRAIPENFLDTLPSLRHLSLSHNSIASVPSLAARRSKLQVLEMRHNEIGHIEADAFESLPSLISLDVSHNRLHSVPTNLLEKNARLSNLRIGGNPFHCDCRLKPLLPALVNDTTTQLHCHSPKRLSGRPVTSLHPADLSCARAIVHAKNKDNKFLKCEYAEAALWMYKGLDIDVSYSGDFSLNDNGTLVVSSSATDNDFSCTFETRPLSFRGRRQSERAQQRGQPQTLGEAPSFTLRPVDNTYREGTPVKLHCEVMGKPRPVVEWFFRGQRLANTRKHEMTQLNQILKVYPFLEGDVGSYTCRASNIIGAIEATARIDLVSSVPPTIFDAPHSITAAPGQHVTFRCKARGVPRPFITWFFDGSEIPHLKGRFSVSADGTELTISHVTRQDDGVFSCMAGNSVGSMMGEGRLSVRGVKAIDDAINEDTIRNIVDTARANVDRAINTTRKQLSQDGVKTVTDLKKLFRFSIPSQAVELSKAREIYEESIRLVNAHVENGLNLVGTDLSAKNISYESVLAPSHVQTIMELSGCQAGLFKNNPCSDMCFHNKYRSYDGQCNNLDNPTWGVSQWPLRRLIPSIYENGFNTPVGWNAGRLYNGFPKPNARLVSRTLVATREITPHTSLSSFVMQWGQLVDHDVTHTPMALSRNAYTSGAICNRTCENVDPCFNIQLLPDDPKLQRGNSHHRRFPCIEFERSGAICGSGETSLLFQRVTQREQMNIITSYLDGSFLYGSTEVQALELRDLFGDHGLMRFDIVSSAQKPYLPFEKDSMMDCRRNNSRENPIRCFLAGDLRANEQLGLTAMHTILLREHNRLAAKLLEINPLWDGERLYHEARKIVGSVMQHITITQWLPLVIGKAAYAEMLGEYKGYNPNVDASVSNVFATAAFRFGHTLINPKLRRLDGEFKTIPQGDIALHEALFAPERMLSEGGVDPLLRGLFASPLKLPKPDQLLNTELTEMLFNRNVEVALDLAVLNIQRARDHGLPGYTEYRRFCNLSAPETWEGMMEVIKDQDVVNKLRNLYGHPANIDVWVGGIVERRLADGLVGPLFACIIGEQFRRMRDGDRFWYENPGVFTPTQLQQIKKASLARLLCDNGDDIQRVQKNVFMYPGNSTSLYERCENHPSINLNVFSACCDLGCESLSTDHPARRRRTLKGCHEDGKYRKHGARWTSADDACTECKCESGAVWCTAVC